MIAAPPPVRLLLGRTRRRLRLVWAVDTMQLAAPVLAAVALGLVVFSRYTTATWPQPAAAVAAVAGLVIIVGAAVVTRLPDMVVARAADRALSTHDAFATSLQFVGSDGFPARIHARAAALATNADPAGALPLPWRRRSVLAGACIAALAVGLTFVSNPQDARRAQQRRERAAVAAAVSQLDAETATIAAKPGSADAAKRLRQLTEQLKRTSSLDRAKELIDQAAAELRQTVSPNLLGQKAATEGLTRSLQQEPMPGASGEQSAADQMTALADKLPSMTPAEREAAAKRLEALAATQAAGSPAASAALQRAATALRAGDVASAQAALGEAGAAAAAADAAVSAQQAAQDAATAAQRAGDTAQSAAQGPGAGQGQGPGSGQGQGPGSGQGQGQGSGNGSGSGSGSGAGGAGSGQGSGQGSGSGSGSGSGGSGTAGGGGGGGCNGCSPGKGGTGAGQGGTGTAHGPKAGQRPDTATIFDPAHGSGGQSGSVGGGTGSGQGGTIGKTNGQTNTGTARVPLSEAIGDYARQATDAMNTQTVSPAVRSLVLAYFDHLQQT